MAYLDMPNAELYKQAIRSPVDLWYTIEAWYDAEIVASDLRPIGGSITDTTKPGVRRKMSVDFSADPGLFDKLAPLGTLLQVTAQVRLANWQIVSIPMGVFDIDSERMSEADGKISVTAADRWAFIQRARFPRPRSSTPNLPVREQISELLREAIGNTPQINITASSGAWVGAMTWEKDRDKAIIDLATSIGAWVYTDRLGVFWIADLPDTANKPADWLVDASESGVLVDLDRERSRARTSNVVIVESSASKDSDKFAAQAAWDSDPTSPTYAGPDPISNPTASNYLFGIVTYYYDTPLPLTGTQAFALALSLVAQQTGFASQVSLGMVPNPAIEAGDVINVLPPRERYDIPRVLERHVVDTVTYPLTLGEAQTIDGRSTRVDEA